MKQIYTQCFSVEDADNLGHFIMSKGYEGVQNDSFRYCLMMIKAAMRDNLRHGRNYCFIGVNGGRLVVVNQRKICGGNTRIISSKRKEFLEKNLKEYEPK